MTKPLGELAHIGHAELLTPEPQRSLEFFTEVLGMEEEAREGQSVYLRGWGDYQRYSLKLTESAAAGLGHMAIRAWSEEALQSRAAAIEAAGRGISWTDGDVGTAPPTASPIPTGTRWRSTTRPSATPRRSISSPP